MRRRAKTITALVCAAAVAATAGGCGNEGSTSQSGSGNSSQVENTNSGGSEGEQPAAEQEGLGGSGEALDLSILDESSEYPKLKEKTTLTVLVQTDTNIEDVETNDYVTKLEEAVNVDLQFEYLPAGNDGKQKLNVLLSSGSDLPDIIWFALEPIEVYTYGSQGYFIPINDYIEQESFYLKNYLDTDEGKENLKYIKSADGNIYAWPAIIEEIGNDYDHRMWINQTWLDELGLEMPTTTDEYYEVLKAFKEKDPNGNGQADEMPLVGNRTGWNQSVWTTLSYPFIYLNDQFDFIIKDDEGKLTVSYAQPEFKDALEYMNKLCSEGLLSPLTFTQDEAQWKQILGDPNGQVIGSLCAGSMSCYAGAPDRKKDLTHLPPLTGPDGVCWTSYRATSLPQYKGFITSSCENPVAAAAVFDYMYSEEMARQGRWGTEGKAWEQVDPSTTESMYESLGAEASFKITDNIWGGVQNQQMGEMHPTLRTYDITNSQAKPDDPFDAQLMTANSIPDYIDKYPKDDLVTRIIYTQEEADQIAEIQAPLKTYREEAIAAFITGTRPLSDWDNYLAELEGIGLQQFLDVAQQAYDRMMEGSN